MMFAQPFDHSLWSISVTKYKIMRAEAALVWLVYVG